MASEVLHLTSTQSNILKNRNLLPDPVLKREALTFLEGPEEATYT
jgi:hypothetical protein